MLSITHALNGILMIAIPIGLGLYLTEKFNFSWRLWWMGAITFILSQVGHIPFNFGIDYLFNNGILPLPPQSWRNLFNIIFLGLSAGLWEETFRFLLFRWWARDARSWRKAILIGAGHGGIEAIVLGILVLLTYFQMLAIRGSDLSAIVPPERLDLINTIVTNYWSAPWYGSLLGSLERVFAIIAHLALSVVVWQTINRNQLRWLWFAIGWHTILNAGALFTAQKWGAYMAEAYLAVIAIISIWIIFRLYQVEPSPEQGPVQRLVPSIEYNKKISPIEETQENLEQTRYN